MENTRLLEKDDNFENQQKPSLVKGTPSPHALPMASAESKSYSASYFGMQERYWISSLLAPVLSNTKIKRQEGRVLSEHQLYNVSFTVHNDDIFHQETDAIVVTSFDRESGKYGIRLGANALRQAGGHITKELSGRLAIMKRSQETINQVVETDAGRLKCKFIIHIGAPLSATKMWKSILTQNIIDSLQKCEAELKCTSITIPLLYSSFKHFGVEDQKLSSSCADVIVTTVLDYFLHLSSRSNIREVKFIDIKRKKALSFKEALESAVAERKVPLEVLARGLEANMAFLNAIEEGSKSIYQTRLMLVGQERVGKTSLTKALTEQKFDVTEEVTDGINSSLSCTLSVRHTTNWKTKTKQKDKNSDSRQQYLRAVAEGIATKLLQKKEPKKSKCQSNKKDTQDIECKDLEDIGKCVNKTLGTYEDNNDNLSTASAEYAGVDIDANSEIEADSPESLASIDEAKSKTPTTPDVPEEIIQLVLEILQEKEKKGDTENLEGTIDELTLSIWDFAGQDLYYITHQVFLVSRAIYIICFNLCHDLSAPAKVEIFKREDGKIIVTEHHMSNLDFIIFWLRSIYSNTNENPSSNQKQLSPPIFIVGTHRESLPGNAEEQNALAEEKFSVIEKALKGTPYEGHVVSRYYAIDNSLRSPLDQTIVDLRDHITEVAKDQDYMGEKIPLKWLDFLNEIEELRKQQKYSVNFKEVTALATKCGVHNESQLFTMLHFYHDLGNIVYHGERNTPDSALNDLIILSPQWLILIFRKVITVKNPSEQWAKFKSSWTKLDKKGILEEKLIRHMWHDFPDKFEGLLQLMQKFDFLCVKAQSENTTEGDRLFYVPSLLKQQDDVVSLEQLIKSKTTAVFYVDFNGFLPEGLFYRLIVRIVQWSQSKSGYEPRLFYQQANLYVDEDHDMIIRIFPQKRSCIQVTISHASAADSDSGEDDSENEVEPCPSVCKMVMELIENNLLYLGHTWMKRIYFDFCVLCRVCYQDQIHFHELKKCLNSNLVPCGSRRMKTARTQRLFGREMKKPEICHQSSVGISARSKVPVFLRQLNGVFNEIASPILPFNLMTEICVLLDPELSSSNDWRGLACKLGYDRYITYWPGKRVLPCV